MSLLCSLSHVLLARSSLLSFCASWVHIAGGSWSKVTQIPCKTLLQSVVNMNSEAILFQPSFLSTLPQATLGQKAVFSYNSLAKNFLYFYLFLTLTLPSLSISLFVCTIQNPHCHIIQESTTHLKIFTIRWHTLLLIKILWMLLVSQLSQHEEVKLAST